MRARRWTTLGTFAGALAGLAFGWTAPGLAAGTAWLGDVFLAALRFLVVPLVASSLVVGVSSLGDVRKTGRLGGLTIVYFVSTTFLAVVLGLVLVLTLRPGEGAAAAAASVPERIFAKGEYTFGDFILSFLGGGADGSRANLFYSLTHMEMLPVILFSLALGLVLTTLGETGRPVLAVARGLYEAVMKIVLGVVLFAPFGVFGLVASKIGSLGGGDAVVAEITKVGMYTATVLIGLSVHAIVVLPAILRFVAGRAVPSYASGMTEALLTAFSTGSSAATLPVTTGNVVYNNRVAERTATFVLPLGATINMDGTALNEGVAVIFIAQTLGVPLALHQVAIVVLLAILASVAAAAIPEAGLVTMVMILQAVHLPIEGIGLILAVDWFLDRCRTAVNVMGDMTVSSLLDGKHRELPAAAA